MVNINRLTDTTSGRLLRSDRSHSGRALEHHIDIGGGIVDEDCRGNRGVIPYNHSDIPFIVSRCDHIAEIICQKILFTYLLIPRCRVLLEKLTGLQLVKKFPAFYGTRMFITALTSVRHLSLSWANPIQSTYPHPNSWRSILILSTHLRLDLPSGLFQSGIPTKTLYAPLSSTVRATCPAHPILLDFITRTILGEEYRSKYLLSYIRRSKDTRYY